MAMAWKDVEDLEQQMKMKMKRMMMMMLMQESRNTTYSKNKITTQPNQLHMDIIHIHIGMDTNIKQDQHMICTRHTTQTHTQKACQVFIFR